MSEINFKPWVGSNYYNSRFGIKVLILGESHYADPEDEVGEDWTQYVVRQNGMNVPNSFFTRTAKAVLGLTAEQALSGVERADLWGHVAFYNYIQEIVGTEGRIRPTKAMWESAPTAFTEVIETLKPDVIVVLGSELGEWIPEVDGCIEMAFIHHPSYGGFSYETNNPVIQDALLKAKTKKG